MTLHTQELQTLAQVRAFVSGNDAISFTLTDRHAAYGWMTDTLRQFNYAHCTRADKGVLRQYLLKVTGLSRAQVARCIHTPQRLKIARGPWRFEKNMKFTHSISRRP